MHRKETPSFQGPSLLLVVPIRRCTVSLPTT